MNFSASTVATALREEDIEGLIASGAPADEYATEAKQIASALTALKSNQLNAATVSSVIALVWAKSFNRSAEEIKQRIPAFQHIAERLLTIQ